MNRFLKAEKLLNFGGGGGVVDAAEARGASGGGLLTGS